MCRLGPYAVIKKIGSGQFGSAYMVKHAVTGTMLCMKKIPINEEVFAVRLNAAVSTCTVLSCTAIVSETVTCI